MTDQAGVVSSSLDSRELTLHAPNWMKSAYQRQLHFWARDQRQAVQNALIRTQQPASVLKAFDHCGTAAAFYREEGMPHHITVRSERCRHRFCPSCARVKGWMIQENIQTIAASSSRRVSMLTLTLRHTKCDLRERLRYLLRCFAEIRRMAPWHRAVRGGIYSIEVHVTADGMWHPHIHVLMEADYIEVGWISTAWKAITEDSTIVDIRRIGLKNAARYVSKYITKPMPAESWKDASTLERLIMGTKRVRMHGTFGTWRKDVPLTKPNRTPPKMQFVGYVETILDEAAENSDQGEAARKILRDWAGLDDDCDETQASGP